MSSQSAVIALQKSKCCATPVTLPVLRKFISSQYSHRCQGRSVDRPSFFDKFSLKHARSSPDLQPETIPFRGVGFDLGSQNSEISGILNASVADSRCRKGSSWIKPQTCSFLAVHKLSPLGFRWQPCKITNIRLGILSCTRSRNKVQRRGLAHGQFIHPAGVKTTAISLTSSGWWLKCCRTINCEL
jgi:hypothetical protein